MLFRRVWPSRPTFDTAFVDSGELRREMARLLDAVTGESAGAQTAGVFPPMNVTQDDEAYYIRAEIPGVRASELSISALRNRVSIAGKREIPPEHERVSYHRRERPEGSFNRAVTLPTEVEAERVEASYADGVLTVTLPKATEARPRQIAVKA